MKYPKATPNGFQAFASCEPLKHDGNVVKMYVHHAKRECPLYVLYAKKWTPPPSTTTSQSSSDLSEAKDTTSNSSEANTTLWIVIGIGI
uniref:Uncharacterized protein n=1 Tax=Panagrolaimus sp. PS1159 TaxID=55785 RepID=A0AC35FCE3_9BILA